MPSFVVNGALTLSGDPTAPNQVATKGYVDSKVTNMDASHVGGVAPLAGARMPALSGDLIANQGNTTLTLAPTGVVAGSYTKVRTDANGRIVEGVSTVVDDYSAYISFTNILPVSRPNSLAGYGITEAVRTDGTTMTGVLSLGSSSFAATELVTKGYVDSSRDTALYGKTISAGDIFIRPSTIAPTGYLRCNGGLVSKMAYPDLYAVIGDGSPVQLSDYGNGRPWEQQYNINTTQTEDVGLWDLSVNSLPVGTYLASSLVTKSRVYLIGGYTTTPVATIYSAAINADGTLGTWGTSTPLPNARAGSQLVVVSNRVFLISGYDSGSLQTTSVLTAVIDSSGIIGAWTSTSALPVALSYAVSVVVDNKIYVMGGYNIANGVQDTIYVATVAADGSLGPWTVAGAIPSKLQYATLCVIKNRIYLIGGQTVSSQWTSTIYSAVINADTTISSWTSVGSTPSIHAHTKPYVTGGRIYLLGGWESSTGVNGNIFSAPINADGTLGGWDVAAVTLPGSTMQAQVVSTKDHLYVIGGYTGSGVGNTSIYEATISGGLNDYSTYYAIPVENVYNTGKPWQQHYDQNTDQVSGISSWTAGTSLPAAIKNAQAVVTKDRVYLIGGTNGTTTLTSVYTASVAADGTLGAWSAATSLPVATANAQVCTTMNRIYLIGGDNGTTQSNKVYCAVIAADGTISSWTESAVLPETFSRGQVLATYRRVYIFAGLFNGVRGTQSYYSDIAADGTLGAWVAGGALPVSVADARLICTKRIAYLIDGTTAAGNANTYCKVGIQPDGSLGTWTKLTTDVTTNLFGVNSGALPTNVTTLRITGKGGDGGAVTTVNLTGSGAGTITAGVTSVAITGRGADGTIGATSGGYAFTPGTTGTVQIPPNCSIVTVGGKGEDGSGYFNSDLSSTGGKPWLNQYDINTTQSSDITGWTTDTSLPATVAYSQAIVTKNRVYLLGGYNDNGSISTVCTAPIGADGTLGTWTTGTSLPATVGSSQAIVTKNRVYLLGGHIGGSWSSTVYTAPVNSDGTLGTWTTGASLPTTVGSSQAIVTKNRVYLLGGYNGGAYSSTVYTAPINSDGTLGTWTTGASLPGTVGHSHAIVTKNRVYLLGGYIGGSWSSTVYTAPINSDGTLGTWTTGTSLPTTVGSSQAIVTKNRVYLLGGYNGPWSSTVYTAPISGGLNDYSPYYDGVTYTVTSSGASATFTYDGVTYTAPGGVGVPATTQSWSLPATTSTYKPLTFNVPANGTGNFQYIETTYTAGANTVITVDGQAYTFSGGNGQTPAVQTTQNITVSGGQSPSYTYSVPTSGALGLSYQVTTTSTNTLTGNGSINLPVTTTTVAMTAKGEDGYKVPSVHIGSGKPWEQQALMTGSNNSGNITGWTVDHGGFPGNGSRTACAVTKNKVYIIGGYNGSSAMSAIYRANIVAGVVDVSSWSVIANLPFGVYDHEVVVTHNRIHVIGGVSSGGESSAIYSAVIDSNGNIGSWSQTGSLPAARCRFGVAITKNRIYVIGSDDGTVNPTLNGVYTATVNADGSFGTWTSAPNLVYGVTNPAIAVTANRLYVIGGVLSSGFTAAYVQYATINTDGTIGAWSTTTSLLQGCAGGAAYVTTNEIYYYTALAANGDRGLVYRAPLVSNEISSWIQGTQAGGTNGVETLFTVSNKLYILSSNAGANHSLSYATITGGSNNYSAYYDGVTYADNITGASSTITLNGVTYTFPGGVGIPAVSSTQNASLPGVSSLAMSYSMAPGVTASTSYSYVASGNGAATTVTVNGTTYTFAGGVGAPATETTQLVTIPNTGPAYSHNVPTYGYARFEYTTVSEGSLLPEPLSDFQTYTTANTAYIFGGKTNTAQTATYTASIDYNGRLSAWTASTALPVATYAADLIAVKNKLYILGGANTTGATPVVHYATILGGKNDYSGAYSTAQYTMYSSDFRLPDFSTIETTGSYYYIKT